MSLDWTVPDASPSPESVLNHRSYAAGQWRDTLWDELRSQSERLTGSQVVDALGAVSEALYAAGVDHAFHRQFASAELTDEASALFDICWMSSLIVQMQREDGK